MRLTVFSLFLFFATPSFATTYYLATSGGSNGNSCSAAQNVNTPKATFMGATGAFSCLSGGDTLQVRAGNYNEELYLPTIPSGTGFPTGATTIMGYPGDAHPVVQQDMYLGGTTNNLIWSGIDFNNTGLATSTLNCVTVSGGTNVHFTNMEVHNCQQMGFLLFPGNASISNFILDYSKVHDTGIGNPMGQPGGHAIYLSGSISGGNPANTMSGFTFDHNELGPVTCPGATAGVNANCWPFQMFQAAGPNEASISNVTLSNSYLHDGNEGGALIGSGSNNLFYNNVIANNGKAAGFGEAGITVGYGQGGSNNRIINNTVTGTGNGGHCMMGQQFGTLLTGTLVINNICYNNPAGNDFQILNGFTFTDTTNDFGTNPNFIASTGCTPGGNNFGIGVTSPAHNAGTNEWTVFTTDYAGNARPQAGSWDQGACMFVNVTPPPPAGTLIPFTVTDLLFTRNLSGAVAPGASFGALHVRCGTNAGTLKLTINAGTSSTETTIIDNIGTGVTGC